MNLMSFLELRSLWRCPGKPKLKPIVLFGFLTLIFLTGKSAALAHSKTPPKPSAIEQELLALEKSRSQAIKNGDMNLLDRIYADDFIGIAGNGQVIDKSQLLEVFKRNDPQVVFTTDEIKVRVYGRTAIFTGRLIGKAPSGAVVLASRFTHVFVKRSGRWQCVAGQSTGLPK
jgi:ketosteroid isomerase-like protein